MSFATGLDHVGLASRDPDAPAAWQRLGFAPDDGGRTILRHGYVEFLPVGQSATVARFLERYAGIHLLSLAIDDEAAAQARLRRAGLSAEIIASERPAWAGGPLAKFLRLPLTDQEPRLQLLRHLTPDLVWRDAVLDHPNHAVALEAVVMAVADPAAMAARLSRLAGRPVVPDPAGGYALVLRQGRVRVLPPEALGTVFPGTKIPSLPFVAGIELRTDDGNAAATNLLGSAASTIQTGLLAKAAGTTILFSG